MVSRASGAYTPDLGNNIVIYTQTMEPQAIQSQAQKLKAASCFRKSQVRGHDLRQVKYAGGHAMAGKTPEEKMAPPEALKSSFNNHFPARWDLTPRRP